MNLYINNYGKPELSSTYQQWKVAFRNVGAYFSFIYTIGQKLECTRTRRVHGCLHILEELRNDIICLWSMLGLALFLENIFTN